MANGTLRSGEDGRALQNVLICVEMIVAAPFMMFAFPSSDYAEAGPHTASLNELSFSSFLRQLNFMLFVQ